MSEWKEGKEVGENESVWRQVGKLKVEISSRSDGVHRQKGLVLLRKGSDHKKLHNGSGA